MTQATLARISEISLRDIAEILDDLYRAFDDIQGFIEDGEPEEAKKVALEMMQHMEDDVV